MPQKVRIALDAMGGDHGAPVAIAGADSDFAKKAADDVKGD